MASNDETMEIALLEEEGSVLLAAAAAAEAEAEDEDTDEEEEEAREKSLSCKEWMEKHKGHFHQLMPDLLASDDQKSYKNILRVDEDLYTYILERVKLRIQKQDTNYCLSISAEKRLAITLRFLATGESYKSLAFGFRVASNTISKIVSETCEVINDEFMNEVLKCPSTEAEWKAVAEGFENKWNFYHCIGALDGKHIAMKKPAKSGSIYYNYKGFFSQVLMALVDSNYQFLYINMGARGSSSDGGIFKDTGLFRILDSGMAHLPPAEPFPGAVTDIPYFIATDDAFAMGTWIVKPYPHKNMTKEERILNYRVSGARRVVENTFGILASRFRVLLSTMQLIPENVKKVTQACCVLHNLIAEKRPRQVAAQADREDPVTHQRIPGAWREELQGRELLNLEPLRGNTSTKPEKDLRNYLRDYYNSEVGAVPWQENMI
jgi:hypothetical protein